MVSRSESSSEYPIVCGRVDCSRKYPNPVALNVPTPGTATWPAAGADPAERAKQAGIEAVLGGDLAGPLDQGGLRANAKRHSGDRETDRVVRGVSDEVECVGLQRLAVGKKSHHIISINSSLIFYKYSYQIDIYNYGFVYIND